MGKNRESLEKIWPRPNFEPGGRKAEFEFFCFATEAVPSGVPFDLSAEGYFGTTLPSGVGMRTDFQDDSPEPLLMGSLAEQLLSEHPELATEVASIYVRYCIVGDVPDPTDLGYLQAAWAAVRWHLRHGAFVVRDSRMLRWRTRDEVLTQQPTDPSQACGWRVMREDFAEPNFGHLVYTQGLAKFGRPDIITAVPLDVCDDAVETLHKLAAELAYGRRLPITEVNNSANSPFSIEAYVPGMNAPRRDFMNEEVVFLKLK
jgi:hypothetical protein